MILYLQLLLIGLTGPYFDQSTENIDSSKDQEMVEQEVVNWADRVFVHHTDYKFDYFKAHYTDDYFIQSMRIETYDEKIAELENRKDKGNYHGSEERYQADHQKLTDALDTAKVLIDKIDRVTHFESHFWTNIQTNDGMTVYYKLIVKLDNDYNVIEALENSSIGKKNTDTRIAYKKDVLGSRVIEK